MDKKISSKRKQASYQALVDDAAEIRGRNKIIFDPNESTESLQEWLEHNKPSQIRREDGAGWIVVQTKTTVIPDISNTIDRLQAEWEVIKLSHQPIRLETIQNLAVKYNDTIGKWLFQVPPKDVDNIWPVIATSIVDGELSKCCLYGKVSPRESRYREENHVISVYNENFTNEEVVRLIEKELRNLGVTSKMFYKTDAFTQCRIYPGNVWRLPSSIYTSVYDPIKCLSEIESRLPNQTNELKNRGRTNETRHEQKLSGGKWKSSGKWRNEKNYGTLSKLAQSVSLFVSFKLKSVMEGRIIHPNEIEILAANVTEFDPMKAQFQKITSSNTLQEPEIKSLPEMKSGLGPQDATNDEDQDLPKSSVIPLLKNLANSFHVQYPPKLKGRSEESIDVNQFTPELNSFNIQTLQTDLKSFEERNQVESSIPHESCCGNRLTNEKGDKTEGDKRETKAETQNLVTRINSLDMRKQVKSDMTEETSDQNSPKTQLNSLTTQNLAMELKSHDKLNPEVKSNMQHETSYENSPRTKLNALKIQNLASELEILEMQNQMKSSLSNETKQEVSSTISELSNKGISSPTHVRKEAEKSDASTSDSTSENEIPTLALNFTLMDDKCEQSTAQVGTEEQSSGKEVQTGDSTAEQHEADLDSPKSEYKLLVSFKLRNKRDKRELRPEEFEMVSVQVSQREQSKDRHWQGKNVDHKDRSEDDATWMAARMGNRKRRSPDDLQDPRKCKKF